MVGGAAGVLLYAIPYAGQLRTLARGARARRAERAQTPTAAVAVGAVVATIDLTPSGIGLPNVEFATQRELTVTMQPRRRTTWARANPASAGPSTCRPVAGPASPWSCPATTTSAT